MIDTHSMLHLHKRIEEETKIPIAEQDVILANGLTPDVDKPASQCWLEPVNI